MVPVKEAWSQINKVNGALQTILFQMHMEKIILRSSMWAHQTSSISKSIMWPCQRLLEEMSQFMLTRASLHTRSWENLMKEMSILPYKKSQVELGQGALGLNYWDSSLWKKSLMKILSCKSKHDYQVKKLCFRETTHMQTLFICSINL